MPILKVGQTFEFKLSLKVLRAFAQGDSIYYIVGIKKKHVPINVPQKVLWGVLKVDGTYDTIPDDILARASKLVAKENLLKKLE